MENKKLIIIFNQLNLLKVHLKKPENSDGSYLEQSLKTKPPPDKKITSSEQSTTALNFSSFDVGKSKELQQCLSKIKRSCTFELAMCWRQGIHNLTTNNTQIDQHNNSISFLPCQFSYKINQHNTTIAPQSSLCSNLMTTENNWILNKTETTSNFNQECFKNVSNRFDLLLDLNKIINFSCFLNGNSSFGQLKSEGYECEASVRCEYINTELDQQVNGNLLF